MKKYNNLLHHMRTTILIIALVIIAPAALLIVHAADTNDGGGGDDVSVHNLFDKTDAVLDTSTTTSLASKTPTIFGGVSLFKGEEKAKEKNNEKASKLITLTPSSTTTTSTAPVSPIIVPYFDYPSTTDQVATSTIEMRVPTLTPLSDISPSSSSTYTEIQKTTKKATTTFAGIVTPYNPDNFILQDFTGAQNSANPYQTYPFSTEVTRLLLGTALTLSIIGVFLVRGGLSSSSVGIGKIYNLEEESYGN